MSQTIVTVSEMRACEAQTMALRNIDEEQLMEAAGKALFHHFLQEVTCDTRKRLLILAGLGNNGGDALVFARHARAHGFAVTVFIIGDQRDQTDSAQKALIKYGKTETKSLLDTADLELLPRDCDILVDGIFGIGLDREVTGFPKMVIERVNGMSMFVCSLDIPSGIDAISGNAMGTAVRANHTAVIGYLKQGNLLNDALDYSGTIRVVDIGLSPLEQSRARKLVGYEDIVPVLAKRRHRSHKYDYGSILVVGGDIGMMGAPQMTAMASLRCGAGLATVALRKTHQELWTQIYPEVMFAFYDDVTSLMQLFKKKNFCVIGPGMALKRTDQDTMLQTLLSNGLPLLIDAGGLELLDNIITEQARINRMVITPHAGEMARMLGITVADLEKSPEEHIRKFTDQGFTVVLKGQVTIIASDTEIVYTIAGHPGMASAGMGDVLSGVIAAFAGQGLSLFEAAKRGVLVHARAAAIALQQLNEASLVAGDVIDKLNDAILSLI